MLTALRRLRARIKYRHFDRDLKRELDTHRAMAEDELRETGATAAEARTRAALSLGNATAAREQARGVWIPPSLESVWQDTSYAVRSLRRSPGFTLPALVVLVITMGLTTSLFATVESVPLRPWSVPDAGRVVSVITEATTEGATFWGMSPIEFRYLGTHARTIMLVALDHDGFRGQGPGGELPLAVRMVSGGFFDALRLPLETGRGLREADDRAGGASAVAVISHDLWQQHFGRAASAVGSTLRVANSTFTVVGVAAPGARDGHFPVPQVWVPLSAASQLKPEEAQRYLTDPKGCCVEVAGRLSPGVDRRTAEAELGALATQFEVEHGGPPTRVSVTSTALVSQPAAARSIPIVSLLSAGVLLMLLLGCANVGNLHLARGLSRRRDLAVRASLGATTGRLVRQLLTEGLLLSVIAAAVALVIAWQLPRFVLGQFGDPTVQVVGIGWTAVVFACSLAATVCLVSGVLPALRVTRLGTGDRSSTFLPSRLRGGLLAVQVAITTVLLIAAGLLARGLDVAAGASLGFDPYGVASVSIGLPDHLSQDDRRQRSAEIVRLAEESGIGSIAATTWVPFGPFNATYELHLSGPNASRKHRAVTHVVSPGYFDVLRIPLVAGSLFDRDAPPSDVVINQSLARLLWPNEAAIGKVFIDKDEKRVIGVVADAHTERFDVISPMYYQLPTGAFRTILVRDGGASVAIVRDIVTRVAPGATPAVTTLVPGLSKQLAPSLTGIGMATAIGLLALLLATVGTFGVFSYIIGERTHEIGVRLTLGARGKDIVSSLAGHLRWPLVAGLAVGVLAAQALGSVLQAALYGLSGRDPLAYAAVFAILAVAACVAIVIPARRALRVDPAVTLRHE